MNEMSDHRGASRQPTLAVILSVYNHATLLPRALDALLSQSRRPDQLIVADDASTDATWAVIQNYAGRYSCIRAIRNERNMGVVGSANHMLKLVTCSHVYGAAADDYVLPSFFEDAMRLAERCPDAGIIFGGVDFFLANVNETHRLRISNWTEETCANPNQVLTEWLRRLPAEHSFAPAVIYRLQSLRGVGAFRPELGPFCDSFALQSVALQHGACYTPRACVVFNVNPNGYSGSTLNDFKRAMGFIDRFIELMKSPEFSDRFPREYVAWWTTQYRRYLIAPQVHLLLHHARRFWVQLARLGFIPHARSLILRLVIGELRDWIRHARTKKIHV